MTSASPIILVSEVDLTTPVYPSDYLDAFAPRDMMGTWTRGFPGIDPLTVSRNVEDSRGYVFQASPFPGTDLLINSANPALNGIAPYTQVDGVTMVPPESLMLGISCTSLQGEGFDYRIYDKTLNKDYFYGQFASNYMLGNYNTFPDSLLTAVDTSLNNQIVGQFFFPTPVMIVGSGELNCSLVNRSANYNICQFYMIFACPGSYNNVAIAAVDIGDLVSGN